MQENSLSRPCLLAPNPHKWGLQPGQVLSLGLWSPKTKINLKIPTGLKPPQQRGLGAMGRALRKSLLLYISVTHFYITKCRHRITIRAMFEIH